MAVNNHSDMPLKRATLVKNTKIQKYADLSHSKGFRFMPVVIESTGAIGRSTRAFFTRLLANTTGLPGDAHD